MQECCPVLLDLTNFQENFNVTFLFLKLCKTKPNQMAKSGANVTSLQPVVQNKVMSVEIKGTNSGDIMKEESTR